LSWRGPTTRMVSRFYSPWLQNPEKAGRFGRWCSDEGKADLRVFRPLRRVNRGSPVREVMRHPCDYAETDQDTSDDEPF